MSGRPSLHDLATSDSRRLDVSNDHGDSRREKASHLKKQVPNLDLQKDLPAQYRKKNDPLSPTSPPTGKSTGRKPSADRRPVLSSGSSTHVQLRHHRFMKKQFGHPTWCIFAEKFIWGLEKSGYECRLCSMTVCRKNINEAKQTVCGDISKGLGSATSRDEGIAYTKTKVFTVYLPQGNKKSVLLNPMLPLSKVLEKICFERNIKMEEYVAMDTNGSPIPLNTLLGKVPGSEITFTEKAESTGTKRRILPPTFDEVYAQMGLGSDLNESDRALGGFKQKKSGFAGFLLPAKGASKRGSRRPEGPKSPTNGSSSQTSASTGGIDVSESDATSPRSEEYIKLPVTQRYTIGKELGSGAFSVVYEATENLTGVSVAIKILDRYEDDDEQAAKFKHEIDIISSLDHDNIVAFIELDQDEEHYYVVMELVKAGELFDQVVARGVFSSKDAACVVAQILKALEYMHSEQTAHRDIKPENILFKDNTYEVIKIADFGESKSFKDGLLSTYCGTPDYMAPEIITGQKYGPAVDVWATGVIAYVMLAGFPPFDGENDVEVFASIMGVKYDFPSPEWDDVPREAMDFIESILKADPSARLTATQALQHPWIVSNVPEKYRINTPFASRKAKRKPRHSEAGSEQDSIEISIEVSQSGESGDDDKKRLRNKATNGSSVSRTSSLSAKSNEVPSMPHEDEFEGPLDRTQGAKRVLDALLDTQQLAKTNLVYMGELVTIEAVLRTLTGDPAEALVLPIYWKRLQDIRKLIASDKKRKKKKK